MTAVEHHAVDENGNKVAVRISNHRRIMKILPEVLIFPELEDAVKKAQYVLPISYGKI